ncbi:HpcH/HpaI aldolase/citrate lyase family protein [Metallosphaera hakonensis]|uniref:CoA ester lyase n=1 Tax=Metallosphaera hakonensis JCM 8857 = DSM 7519 TaxID=1293036 RepID=A0A2U9ISL6_9CREN|nr:CoA ester lyase [Metallosphaera hakonensis]AWR99039.1 CoA ester lyase [Metallosphaera hakonensis JCM 8857 = DSM 7519]
MKRRSQLYVPAISEKMIVKSLEIPADSIIFDLEDSVPMEQKDSAREVLRKALSTYSWKGKELCVRINQLTTKDGLKDLLYVSDIPVDTVLIPKAEGSLSFIFKSTGKKVEPIVETPRGLVEIEHLVRSDGVTAISYGAADLSLYTQGQVKGYEGNIYVMTRIATTARAYDVEPVDKVYFDLKNSDGFKNEAQLAKSLGFSGKQVIHPSQVDLANQVFSPSGEELQWYQEVVKNYEMAMKEGRGAIRLRDQLVDQVHYRIAKKFLEDYKS